MLFYSTPILTSFVRKDIAILEKEYMLKVFHFDTSKKWKTPIFFFQQLWQIVWNWRKIEMFVCKFVGYSALLPSLLGKIGGKACLLVTAGTESAYLPSIHYGDFRKPVLGKFTEWSLRMATHIAPVHYSLMLCDYVYNKEIFPQQGVQFFCKNLKTPFTYIPYGFDEKKFVDIGKKRIPNSFLTIAAGFEQEVVFLRKGLDLIWEMAKRFPEFHFTVVGYKAGQFHKEVPSNVQIIAAIPQEKLIELLNEHEFYAQISMFEGFPNALCEAMLCGCIPIGSSVAAIPDIIGDTGFILQEKNTDKLADLLKIATHSDKALLSQKARQRIIDNFLTGRRERELLGLVRRLLSNN